ncbi:hypothetical protein [Dyella japonica]|uniref:Lysozyme inhibitor LprI N-terminal domain-containing protein n=1 Tax=Dyella japonica TaxID=231455 RepID=A0ABV2JUF1_9GAMM
MKTARACLILALALTPMASLAQIRRLPTDTELKAGYCVAVERTQLENLQAATHNGGADRADAEQQAAAIKALSDDVKRLDAYLSPKYWSIEPKPLSEAAGRGLADLESSDAEPTTCRPSAVGQGALPAQCAAQAPASTRLRSCIGAPFLPY